MWNLDELDVAAEDGFFPERSTDGSSGYDIRNYGPPQVIQPGKTAIFPTSVKIDLPLGIDCTGRGRSGLWFKHNVSIGQTGTIDSDYKKEIMVKLKNEGNVSVTIAHGERICQLLFIPVLLPKINKVDELKTKTTRGGFGHTGRF